MALNWLAQFSTVALSCSTKASAQVFVIALSVLLVSCPSEQCVTVSTALHFCTFFVCFFGKPRCYWKCAHRTCTILQKLNEHTVNDALLPLSAVFLLWKLLVPCNLCCAYSVIIVLPLSHKCILALAFILWAKWKCTFCIYSVSVSKPCLLQGTLQLNVCCVLCTNGHHWLAHHINAEIGLVLDFCYCATCNRPSITSVNGYCSEKLHYVAKQLQPVFMVLPLLHYFHARVFFDLSGLWDMVTWIRLIFIPFSYLRTFFIALSWSRLHLIKVSVCRLILPLSWSFMTSEVCCTFL